MYEPVILVVTVHDDDDTRVPSPEHLRLQVENVLRRDGVLEDSDTVEVML